MLVPSVQEPALAGDITVDHLAAEISTHSGRLSYHSPTSVRLEPSETYSLDISYSFSKPELAIDVLDSALFTSEPLVEIITRILENDWIHYILPRQGFAVA